MFLVLASFGSTTAQELSFRNYSVEDGLPSNFIYTVVQGKRGFIWIATEVGISRFDGQHFVNFTTEDGLPENEALKLFEDSSGRIWFVTLKGSFGSIYHDRVDQHEDLKKILPNKIVAISQDWDGNMLFLSETKGLIQVKNSKIDKIYSYPLDIQKSIGLVRSNIFVSARNKEIDLFYYGTRLFHIKNGKISATPVTIDIKHTLRDFLHQSNRVRAYCSILDVEQFNVLGLKFIDDNHKEREVITSEQVDNKTILAMQVTEDLKDLWVGTTSGLYHFQGDGYRYRRLGLYLKDQRVSTILRDREGNIWASTLGEGLYLFPTTYIQNLTSKSGIPDQTITAMITGNKGELYIATDRSFVYTIKDGSFLSKQLITPSIPKGKVPYDRIMDMLVTDKGDLWLGKDRGVLVYRDGALKDFLVPSSVKKLCKSYGDEVWVGQGFGLSRTQNGKSSAYSDLITNDRIYSVIEDPDSTLWYSSETGFYSWKNGKARKISDKFPILNEKINSIALDKHHVFWLATSGQGLLAFDGLKVRQYSLPEGLPSNICNSMLLEGDSVIWLATNSGVSKITRSGKKGLELKTYNISTLHGLVASKVTAIQKSGDTVFVGTPNGLSYFNDKDLKPNTYAPPTFITGFKISDKDTTLQPSYTLNYNKSVIRIEFIALAFRCQGKLRYKYKMEGLSDEWLNTSSSFVSFASLPPGKYTFYVKGINEDGLESRTPAKLEIIVQGPYWYSLWFWAAALATLTLIVVLISVQRVKRLKEKHDLYNRALENEQKALRSQMNPHFIFNVLNSIRSYMLKKDTRSADTYLSKFAVLIRQILENSQHSFISIHSEMETVELYIQVEKMRFDQAFDFSISIDPEVDPYNTEIPTMILQPYVENAIWHGLLHKDGKGKLEIEITKRNEDIVIILEDDGIGREKSKELRSKTKMGLHKSLGMSITEERLNNLNLLNNTSYHVEIFDLKDKQSGEAVGTRVEIIFTS